MDTDEGAGHWRVAGQEQWLPFFEEAGEPVADGVGAEIRPVVTNTYDYHGRFVGTCQRFTSVL